MTKLNSHTCDCIVIGGGAAGMMSAVCAAQGGASVILIEHTARLGSKILQTGNGKCNFTNLHMQADCYQNGNPDFVMQVLNTFPVQDTLEFFENAGIYHKDRNGYVYPHSETAASLQSALRYEVEQSGVTVFTEQSVLSVEKKDGSFYVTTDTDSFCGHACILATGSKAAPKTGSDGSGYTLARKFGHHIIKPLPALVQLTSDNSLCKAMSGVRSTGTVTVFADGNPVASDTGEIQYTDYGISGIPVFQVSRYAVKAADSKRIVTAVVDMLPDFEAETLITQSIKRMYQHNTQDIVTFFSGLLNKKLVQAVAKSCGYPAGTTMDALGKKGIAKMITAFKDFSFDITGSRSFDAAQICQGGVSLSEIDPQSMQSLKCRGLFFAGELLDVDGKCGGYNLQWAWSSGHLAGTSAAQYCISQKGTHYDSN